MTGFVASVHDHSDHFDNVLNFFLFCFLPSANKRLFKRLDKIDRKLTTITKMIRKVMKEGKCLHYYAKM